MPSLWRRYCLCNRLNCTCYCYSDRAVWLFCVALILNGNEIRFGGKTPKAFVNIIEHIFFRLFVCVHSSFVLHQVQVWNIHIVALFWWWTMWQPNTEHILSTIFIDVNKIIIQMKCKVSLAFGVVYSEQGKHYTAPPPYLRATQWNYSSELVILDWTK